MRMAVFLSLLAVFLAGGAGLISAEQEENISSEVAELYAKNVFRLWGYDEKGEFRPRCTYFYLKPSAEKEISFIASAGHCYDVNWIVSEKRGPQKVKIADLQKRKCWGEVFCLDYMVAMAADERLKPAFFKKPRKSFPAGEEAVGLAENFNPPEKPKLQKLRLTEITPEFLIFEGEFPAQETMSGAPIVSLNGELLGILVSRAGLKHWAVPIYSIPSKYLPNN